MAVPSGLTADGETENRCLIVGLLVERKTQLDTQGTERRHPADAGANRLSELTEVEVIEGITHIKKSHAAQTVGFHDRKEQLGVHDDCLIAARHIIAALFIRIIIVIIVWTIVLWRSRPQTPLRKPAHRIDAAEKIALEERQVVVTISRVAGKTEAVAHLPTQSQNPVSTPFGVL